MTDSPTSNELVEAAKFAADVLSELYAKYGTKIGPFASQAQKANVMLGAALRAADEPSVRIAELERQVELWKETCQCKHCLGIAEPPKACHLHPEAPLGCRKCIELDVAGWQLGVNERCPTCRSPEPHRHPTGDFGEPTRSCNDPWHSPTKAGSSQPTSQQVGRDLPTDETRATHGGPIMTLRECMDAESPPACEYSDSGAHECKHCDQEWKG